MDAFAEFEYLLFPLHLLCLFFILFSLLRLHFLHFTADEIEKNVT